MKKLIISLKSSSEVINDFKKALRNTDLIKLMDTMAHSKLKEVQTLGSTLFRWKKEILNYFKTRLTNAMTEGFNNKAKLVKRSTYGYKSFKNYRLRLLNAFS